MSVIVRDLGPQDETRWAKLWAAYLEFYESSVSADVTAATWGGLLDPASSMFALVAEVDGQVVGFANCVLHANTWATAPVCYLQDLFTAPSARGQGVGQALIEAVATRAKRDAWHRVYWRTASDNVAAQALYDKMAKRTAWVTYEINDL